MSVLRYSQALLAHLLHDLERPYDESQRIRLNYFIEKTANQDNALHSIAPFPQDHEIQQRIADLHTTLAAATAHIPQTISKAAYQTCRQLPEFNAYRQQVAPTESLMHTDDALAQIDSLPSIAMPFIRLFTDSAELLQSLYSEYGIDKASTTAFELLQAIEQQRSTDNILSLAKHIDTLPDNLILVLATHARGDLLDDFIARGMPLNSVDKRGKGALYYALSSPKPVPMFISLVKKGVQPQATDLLMQRIIDRALYDNHYMPLVAWAVQHMPVTRAHISYFMHIANTSQPNYLQIKQQLDAQQRQAP